MTEYRPESRGDNPKFESVDTNTAIIGGYPASITASKEMVNNVEHVTGAAVTVGGSRETIFDVEEPVIILAGTLNGRAPGDIEYTFDDGTVVTVGAPGFSTGKDGAGNLFDSRSLPPGRNVTKISFINLDNNERDYGYVIDYIQENKNP